MQYIYLHGFASSPQSYKARSLSDCFKKKGLNLQVLDLNQDDFTNLTLTRQIRQTVANFNNSNIPITLIGSSLGGLTAAWIAEKYPQVQRLVLLAPAFNCVYHWHQKFSREEIEQWQESGYLSVYHYKENKLLPLSYGFWLDINQYQESLLQRKIPTLIIHGEKDQTISIQASIDYAQQHLGVQLISLDSDHGLGDKLEVIWQEIKSFCSIS